MLTDQLESDWKGDEASGQLLDSVGSNDLTDNNTVGTGTGHVFAAARDYEASNSENHTIADNASLSPGNTDFTFECWFKSEANPFSARAVIIKGNGSNCDYLFDITGGEVPRWRVFGSNGFGNQGQALWGSGLFDTNWHHAIMWHDSVNDLVGLQIDNGTPVTTAHSAGVRDGTEIFAIGGGSDFNFFDGLLGPTRYWSRMLTSDERDELWNSGAGLDDLGGGGEPAVLHSRLSLLGVGR